MSELPVLAMATNVFWTWILPALLFGFTCVATWMLYRHFMNQDEEDES